MAVGGVSACYYIASDDHSDSGNDDHDDPSDRGYRYLQDENDDYGNEEEFLQLELQSEPQIPPD